MKMVELSEVSPPGTVYAMYPSVDRKSDPYLKDVEPVAEGASSRVFVSFRLEEMHTKLASKVWSRVLTNEKGRKVQVIDQEDVDRCIREIELLRECSEGCEFIIDFVDAVNVYPEYFEIVMELAEPIQIVFDHSTINQADLKMILYCLVSALAHIHSLGVAHGDVKPGNLLYAQKGCVKLCDFGAAWRVGVDDRKNLSEIGTVSYAAPEILPIFIDNSVDVPFSMKQDIWAAGMVAFNGFYCSQLPEKFQVPKEETAEASDRAWLSFLKSGGIQFAEEDDVNPALADFVHECTRVENPEQRPTAEELLQSEFIGGLSQEKCREQLANFNSKIYTLRFELEWKKEVERDEQYSRYISKMRKDMAIEAAEAAKEKRRRKLLWSNPFLYAWKKARGTI